MAQAAQTAQAIQRKLSSVNSDVKNNGGVVVQQINGQVKNCDNIRPSMGIGGALVVAETAALAAATTMDMENDENPEQDEQTKIEAVIENIEDGNDEEEVKLLKQDERNNSYMSSCPSSSRCCSVSNCSLCLNRSSSGAEDEDEDDEEDNYETRMPRKRSMNIQTDLTEEDLQLINSSTEQQPIIKPKPNPPPVPKRGTKRIKAPKSNNVEVASSETGDESVAGHGRTHRIVINLDDRNRFTDEVTV